MELPYVPECELSPAEYSERSELVEEDEDDVLADRDEFAADAAVVVVVDVADDVLERAVVVAVGRLVVEEPVVVAGGIVVAGHVAVVGTKKVFFSKIVPKSTTFSYLSMLRRLLLSK